jgi:ligand-binding SRPBCC domain-containing protein
VPLACSSGSASPAAGKKLDIARREQNRWLRWLPVIVGVIRFYAMATRHRLEREQLVRAPRSAVFEFFSAAENLERLTPPFLKFQILSPLPIEMRAGQHIEYRIALGFVPMRWLTEITEWQPATHFVDEQLRGPYRYWHHLHEFSDAPDGTLMRDVVDYELPLGPLGGLAHEIAVRHLLRRIFDYRFAAVALAFPDS